MDDLSRNIKKVLIVFLLCFLALISYISYFDIFVAPQVVKRPENRRLWVKRNEVLRGTIFDRNNNALTTSKKIDKETQKREYTGGPVFAHVLGYVDPRFGLTGLEKKYDEELMADDSPIQKFFSKSGTAGENKEKIGHNLITTLDMNLQQKVYDLLGDNRGAIVVLNPKTGEVLAMVSKPSFDPNNLAQVMDEINKADKNSDIRKNSPLLNRAVSGLYPPGSTFKTITAIAALENINNAMNKTIEDKGKIVFNPNESLSNYGGVVNGTLDLKSAFAVSSNVYFGTIGMELGNSKLKATAEKFYFNKDLPADGITIDNSRFPELKSYEKGNIAQSAIGQSSVLATPIEMATVAATIANDGVMMRPYLVQQVTNSKGTVLKTIDPKSSGQIINKGTASTMKELMRSVVTSGSGKAAEVKGMEVCGKTGTADYAESITGEKKPHAWFIGFAPYNNPRIAVAVLIEEGGTGGGKAAPIAASVISAAASIGK